MVGSVLMADVMIGIDPHKGSHTAVAIGLGEEPLGELRVDACPSQAGQLLAWAQEWPERAWAIEGAAGLGNLLAQQLVAAGERVLDVPPKLAARVRLLQSGNTSKNDPKDAYSVAAAALRSKGRPGDRRHRDRRRPPGVPVPWPGPLRLLERHRPRSRCLRRPQEDLRLSLRGNRRVNHAIHMAAISQIRHKRSDGRPSTRRAWPRARRTRRRCERSSGGSATPSTPRWRPTPGRRRPPARRTREGNRGTL